MPFIGCPGSQKTDRRSISDRFVTAEEMLQRVQRKTFHQVRDLKIDCQGPRWKVTGRSRTYYVKQLVTQAILTVAPAIELDNEIQVRSSC